MKKAIVGPAMLQESIKTGRNKSASGKCIFGKWIRV